LHDLVIPSPSIVTNLPCSTSHRHPGRDGDAAQPLSASSIVQSRRYERTPRKARGHPHGQHRFGAGADDCFVCECGHSHRRARCFIAAALRGCGIQDAYKMLTAAWRGAASTLFAIGCWPAARTPRSPEPGRQVVMEGFIHIRLSPWLRRMITRSLAIIPPSSSCFHGRA